MDETLQRVLIVLRTTGVSNCLRIELPTRGLDVDDLLLPPIQVGYESRLITSWMKIENHE